MLSILVHTWPLVAQSFFRAMADRSVAAAADGSSRSLPRGTPYLGGALTSTLQSSLRRRDIARQLELIRPEPETKPGACGAPVCGNGHQLCIGPGRQHEVAGIGEEMNPAHRVPCPIPLGPGAMDADGNPASLPLLQDWAGGLIAKQVP